MTYTLYDIATLLGVKPSGSGQNFVIENLLTDSRKLIVPETTLFFAINGPVNSAYPYIAQLYGMGVRAFVVDLDFKNVYDFPEALFLVVENPLNALQHLATYHRSLFKIPVIGITGSNGKTIVKEWLDYFLNDKYRIVKSPKSYNSQIGVPLSVWQMAASHTLAIFEAGISQKGEMEKLEHIIKPDVCLITTIGEAHASGFKNIDEKIEEKLLLCKGAKLLICNNDDHLFNEHVTAFSEQHPALRVLSWGFNEQADLIVTLKKRTGNATIVLCSFRNQDFELQIPYRDMASVSNALTCISLLLYLNISVPVIAEKLHHLPVVEMRLEMRAGINNCSVINDSYISDLTSLVAALDFMAQQHQHLKKTIILSDVFQLRKDVSTTYRYLSTLLNKHEINRLIAVGPALMNYRELFSKIPETHFYFSTDDLMKAIPQLHFNHETILLKGARVFQFEKVAAVLELQTHDAVFEINLSAIRNNLRFYRNSIRGTKLMAMVKAFSYGAGSFEIANVLERERVDYLAVAYPDEGVELRRNGVSLPIMVMNTEEAGFENMVRYNLEPEIFSFRIAHSFIAFLEHKGIMAYPVHLKMDTGMHRLGFELHDMPALCLLLKQSPAFKIQSVFSHLVGSDNPKLDDFTLLQSERFKQMCAQIETSTGYPFIKHISNSSAILRHPDLRMDMVRLGIGLYGLDNSVPDAVDNLVQVGTLRTTISQIREVKSGDAVGYNRSGVLSRDSTIATIRIGYADGYPRMLGNGVGEVWVNGKLAPVVGNVCMDMTMIDITGLDAREGDSVILFGPQYSVANVAKKCNTIPYEILSGISQRIRRIYYNE